MNLKKVSLIVLDITFLLVIGVLASVKGIHLTFVEVLILGLATVRMARALSFNEIFEWLREPFTKVEPDSCGAGADVHPKFEDGHKAAIGGLLSCPICTGTWSALALLSLWVLVPTYGRYLAYALALAAISEFIHYSMCLMEWGGRLARVTSGRIAPDPIEEEEPMTLEDFRIQMENLTKFLKGEK